MSILTLPRFQAPFVPSFGKKLPLGEEGVHPGHVGEEGFNRHDLPRLNPQNRGEVFVQFNAVTLARVVQVQGDVGAARQDVEKLEL